MSNWLFEFEKNGITFSGVCNLLKRLINPDWRDKFIEDGLTFSDILLRPQYSELETRVEKEGGPSTAVQLTPKIRLAIPIISANMDTVTESNMAIAMARYGGLGIIHRNCGIEEQVEEIKKVKHAEEGLIREPYTLYPGDLVNRARELMAEKQIDSVLIIGKNRELVGLITKYEIASANGLADVSNYMKPRAELIVAGTHKNIAEKEAKTLAEKVFKEQPLLGKLPFVNELGELIGLMTKKDMIRYAEYPDATKDMQGRLRVGAAIGIDEYVFHRARALLLAGADVLVLDVAHAHAENPLHTAKLILQTFPECELIVGNVATEEAIHDFAQYRPAAIKIGIGPGATCSTRIVSGAGVPQVSAILECAREAEKYGIPIIADGGIRDSGDVTKAIGCGASVVMVGTLFAGTDESPGPIINDHGRRLKLVRGMSSFDVNLEKRGTKFLEINIKNAIKPEGISGRIDYRGPLIEILSDLVGGLRAGMTMVGAKTIEDLQKPFPRKFTRMSRAAWEESQPHDIEVI